MKQLNLISVILLTGLFVSNITRANVMKENAFTSVLVNEEKVIDSFPYSIEQLGVLLNVPHLRQCDAAWSSVQLGSCASTTICSHGCALLCICMMLKANGVNITPPLLNTYLNTHSGYVDGCLLKWDVAADYPGSSMNFSSSVAFSFVTIKSEIDDGDPVVVYTKIGSSDHFVLVIGYNNSGTSASDFIVLDPLRTTQSTLNMYSPLISLRTFENVITTSGYASILEGITITPNPVVRTQPCTVKVVLKEVNGVAITFDTLTCAIVFQGIFKFDMPRKTNVTIPAYGTYTCTIISNQFGSGTSLSNHEAYFKGYKGGWFNFSVLSGGVNPLTFNVVAPTWVTQQSSIIPDEFELYQNYPNPFNPETNVNFDLPETKWVKLTLFDIRGTQVQMLIDQPLNAGSYRYLFNAINYTSGIYFYKLETDNFIQIKRMILVK